MAELRNKLNLIIGTHLVPTEVIDKLVNFVQLYGSNQYNEGYDEGDSCGYNRGYDEGKKEGDTEGYERGATDAKFDASVRIQNDLSLTFEERRRIKQRIWG